MTTPTTISIDRLTATHAHAALTHYCAVSPHNISALAARDKLYNAITSRPEFHPQFTFLEMEAMLGLWEAMLEMRDQLPLMDELWDQMGTAHMRLEEVPRIAKLALEAWEALDEDEREGLTPYDWEFLPMVLRWAYTDELNGKQTLLRYLQTEAGTGQDRDSYSDDQDRDGYTNNDHEDDGA